MADVPTPRHPETADVPTTDATGLAAALNAWEGYERSGGWEPHERRRMRDAVAAYYRAVTESTGAPVGVLRAVWLLDTHGNRVELVDMSHRRHEVAEAVARADVRCTAGLGADFVVDVVGLEPVTVGGLLAALRAHVAAGCTYGHHVHRADGADREAS